MCVYFRLYVLVLGCRGMCSVRCVVLGLCVRVIC